MRLPKPKMKKKKMRWALALFICSFAFLGCESLEKAFQKFARGENVLQTGTLGDGSSRIAAEGEGRQLQYEFEKAELELAQTRGEGFSPFVAPEETQRRCRAPLIVPMSPQFADAGDLHGNITIVGNGEVCGQNINYAAPNVAIEFSAIYATSVKPPWRIVSLTAGSQIVITNGQVTLSFRYSRTPQQVTVTDISFV